MVTSSDVSGPADDVTLRTEARALRADGRAAEAASKDLAAIEASSRRPDMVAAIRHLMSGRLDLAERAVRARLASAPDDAAALCLHADIAQRLGIFDEAERLLRAALEIAPDFAEAKIRLADVLLLRNAPHAAVAVLEDLLDREPDNDRAATALIRILGLVGEYESAATICELLLRYSPEDASLHVNHGNVLKTLGRTDEAVAAYRRAIVLDPDSGVAWWSLSNLKSYRFDAADVALMKGMIERPGTSGTMRTYLGFALGAAHEHAGDYGLSFRHYAAANAARLSAVPHDRAEVEHGVDDAISLFSRNFLEHRTNWGATNRDPIFIVGMPRAGSTLIEQILASHSAIEGTSELSIVPMLAHRLVAERWREPGARYPDILAQLDKTEFRLPGQDYLAAAAPHRKTDRPFFIDKLPNNWLYVGFIHLMLPNAKIIDARRDPMACCFSNFKQHFARGQTFAYSLTDLGHYYRDYVRLMAHFDDVAPGVMHRVEHERLVAEPETEIRRLLEFLELPFEPACLRFHENDRPVRTASAEQVRRPISNAGIDQWRNYEPWLGELKDALAPSP